MKMQSELKWISLIVLLIILSDKVFGQNTSFTPDAKSDSIWIEQSLIIANKQHPINIDSNRAGQGKWIGGKVIYSPDGLLRATQLIGDYETFTTTIEYIYHQKIFKQDLNYKPDFSSYAITGIYKLPYKSPAYLFLLSGMENVPEYEFDRVKDFRKVLNPLSEANFKHIKTLSYVASLFRLNKDSLVEMAFPQTADDTDSEQYVDSTDTVKKDSSKSFGFTSDIKQYGKFPRPFLRYDSLAHTLNFLDIYSKDDVDNTDFLRVHSGSFKYRDTSFFLTNDTFYYYPSLESLSKIIARKNYRVGKYIINAEATKSYEDFYGNILPVLTTTYRIGNQTLTTIDNDNYNGENKVDLKPDHRLQNNGSLILLLTDETNGHGPSACGSASYSDSKFWLINNDSHVHQLFSFSYGSCSPAVTYTFIQNGKEVSGNFYLTDKSDDRDNINFDNSYWKNNSTYVFVFNSNETNLTRNFYLHFNLLNKKAPITLKHGKLYEAKNQAGK